MNREKEQAVFRRGRQETMAIQAGPPGAAPQAGIVDVERHFQRRHSRVGLDCCPSGLPKHDFLALQAMDQGKLGGRQCSPALVAKTVQGRNGVRQILVADEEIQIPELAKPQITERLDGEERAFERNCCVDQSGKLFE